MCIWALPTVGRGEKKPLPAYWTFAGKETNTRLRSVHKRHSPKCRLTSRCSAAAPWPLGLRGVRGSTRPTPVALCLITYTPGHVCADTQESTRVRARVLHARASFPCLFGGGWLRTFSRSLLIVRSKTQALPMRSLTGVTGASTRNPSAWSLFYTSTRNKMSSNVPHFRLFCVFFLAALLCVFCLIKGQHYFRIAYSKWLSDQHAAAKSNLFMLFSLNRKEPTQCHLYWVFVRSIGLLLL